MIPALNCASGRYAQEEFDGITLQPLRAGATVCVGRVL